MTDTQVSKATREEVIEHLALNKAAERLTVIMGRFRAADANPEDIKALKRGVLALRSHGSRDEVSRKLTNKVIEEIAEQGYKEHGWRQRIRAIIVNTLCEPRIHEKKIENGVSPRHITNGA